MTLYSCFRNLACVALAVIFAVPGSIGMALAQSYPTKPIRMMVPFPAGGGSDTMGRIVGTRLGERLGQQIVVDNRPGAAGSIGADIAA
ncbi:MAG: tripartite tricarboxylate transporter substrate binding protein, partial [Betaproteobacteria bacterium]|nr:tripartite tricarboxylate transporter substrate binding protein [Betaproteobacteria bacterium]